VSFVHPPSRYIGTTQGGRSLRLKILRVLRFLAAKNLGHGLHEFLFVGHKVFAAIRETPINREQAPINHEHATNSVFADFPTRHVEHSTLNTQCQVNKALSPTATRGVEGAIAANCPPRRNHSPASSAERRISNGGVHAASAPGESERAAASQNA
jgi:hypothetical protein